MSGVVILGGGLAGLGCALNLPGAKVFEAENYLGGRAYSFSQGGVCFDQGAHISHTKNDRFIQLTNKAAGDVVSFSQSKVRNFWDGRWMTYPIQNNLNELPPETRIAALTSLVESHLNPSVDSPGNYQEWCEAQYGSFLTANFYRVFTEKYWRSTPESLGTDWLGGRLLPSQLTRIIAGAIAPQHEQQAAFAKFRYPANGGYYGFFDSLYQQIDVTTNCRAQEIDLRAKVVTFADGRKEHFEQLASSIPLPTLMRMIKDAPSHLVEDAEQLRTTQLLCVNMIVDRANLTDAHWFYIYDADIDVARVSVPGNLSPASIPPGKTALQAEIYRHELEPMEPEMLVSAAQQQLQRVLKFSGDDVSFIDHVHVKRAYVISDHRRGPIVEKLLDWLEQNRIHSMGLYGRWKYVWSDVAFQQGQQVADKIKGVNCAAA